MDEPGNGTDETGDGTDQPGNGSEKPGSGIGHFDLPSTATNIVNMLLIGLLISFTFVAIVLSQRKGTRLNQ
jgi:hypothetical protein